MGAVGVSARALEIGLRGGKKHSADGLTAWCKTVLQCAYVKYSSELLHPDVSILMPKLEDKLNNWEKKKHQSGMHSDKMYSHFALTLTNNFHLHWTVQIWGVCRTSIQDTRPACKTWQSWAWQFWHRVRLRHFKFVITIMPEEWKNKLDSPGKNSNSWLLKCWRTVNLRFLISRVCEKNDSLRIKGISFY